MELKHKLHQAPLPLQAHPLLKLPTTARTKNQARKNRRDRQRPTTVSAVT